MIIIGTKFKKKTHLHHLVSSPSGAFLASSVHHIDWDDSTSLERQKMDSGENDLVAFDLEELVYWNEDKTIVLEKNGISLGENVI